jgi:2-oxoglutarate ferredoxin oxidoreductase subunit gamma
MRGGTAFCTVIVADEPIGSPIVDRADAVVALNPPSMARFEDLLVPGGILVLNASLIEAEPHRRDILVVPVGCSAIARSAGDDRLVSVAALGALIARCPIVTTSAVREALADLIGPDRPALVAADILAFERGAEDAGLALPA